MAFYDDSIVVNCDLAGFEVNGRPPEAANLASADPCGVKSTGVVYELT
jgi:hypothetical protein